MKKILTPLFIFLLCTRAAAYDRVAVYIVAHQDDWQLFMGLEAYKDMTAGPGTKVVFIYTTAGDASCRGKQLDRPYYLAREKGAINSIEFCMDTRSLHCGNNISTREIKGHQLRKFEYKNVVNYFLRLPDGCFSSGLNGESLEFLKKGNIFEMTAVDTSANYYGWSDLVGTIRQIIETESDSARDVTINTADPDKSYNAGDHPDHIYTALAAQEAVKDLPYVSQRLFVEYGNKNLPPNLSSEDLALKSAIYGVTEFGVTQNSGSSNWTKEHVGWLSRDYYRFIASAVDSFLSQPDSNGSANLFTLFPNPATDQIHVCYRLGAYGQVAIRIYDIGGHVVQFVSDELKPAGGYVDVINITGLQAGNYIVRIFTLGYLATISMVKH